MKYAHIRGAVFIDRPNRFIARVTADGEVLTCHVKNTGRCRELLLPGARVILSHSDAPGRKTEYDLVAVYKGERLINMDSAAPNAAFGEWCLAGKFLPAVALVRPETVHGDSRFDFYLEAGLRRMFAEVKGVTLEKGGALFFPDAPTLRGAKHLRGLTRCVEEGYEAACVFVAQTRGAAYFSPNRETDPDFARAMEQAQKAGVQLYCVDCDVTEDSMAIHGPVPIRL